MKILSLFKERKVLSSQVLTKIEDQMSRLESLPVEFSFALKRQLTLLLVELQDINDEKYELATELKEFIAQKIEDHELLVKNGLEVSSSNAKTSRDPTESATAKDTPKNKVKGKRGRKPKRALFTDSEKIPPMDQVVITKPLEKVENEEAVNLMQDLMMLAEVATKQEHISVTPPVIEPTVKTKRKGKPKKLPIAQEPVKVESEETESEVEDETISKEVDENEPLYCVCNKVSFGSMVECDNEGCSIEWCHFNCVGLKRAPKGKW